MAGFIVLNTLRMNFAERRRDMAILRVLGATTRQLATLHISEAIALGFAGSVVGVPLGLLIGNGLGNLMQRVLESPVAAAQIDYRTIGLALMLGPLVSGLAAIVPAYQSLKVAPAKPCRAPSRVAPNGFQFGRPSPRF